jgi:hypothetical protein
MVGRQHRGVSSGFDHDERRGGIGRGAGPGTGTEKRRETDVDVCMMLDFPPYSSQQFPLSSLKRGTCAGRVY